MKYWANVHSMVEGARGVFQGALFGGCYQTLQLPSAKEIKGICWLQKLKRGGVHAQQQWPWDRKACWKVHRSVMQFWGGTFPQPFPIFKYIYHYALSSLSPLSHSPPLIPWLLLSLFPSDSSLFCCVCVYIHRKRHMQVCVYVSVIICWLETDTGCLSHSLPYLFNFICVCMYSVGICMFPYVGTCMGSICTCMKTRSQGIDQE